MGVGRESQETKEQKREEGERWRLEAGHRSTWEWGAAASGALVGGVELGCVKVRWRKGGGARPWLQSVGWSGGVGFGVEL